MEGLEISEILFSNIDSIKKRLDAEYYQKLYLEIDKKIKAIGEIRLSDIRVELDCSAFYPSITEHYDFNGVGVPFLRVNEINGGLVKLSETTAYLPQKILDRNTSTIAIGYPGDLIIAKGGNTLAKVGLITDQYPKYALSRDIILVRTQAITNFNKYFLWLFLHSQYGQAILWRTASQTGQPHLTLPSIKEIPIPKYSPDFETITEKFYLDSVEFEKLSKNSYSRAENILLYEIGLKEFEPSKEAVNIKSFGESFGISGRLDAEYYQLKYEDYLRVIDDYQNGSGIIDAICNVKGKNFTPDDKTKYKYIELSNVGKTGDINGCTVDLGKELPSRARRKVSTGDVIISSIEGSLDSCALVTKQYDDALCSTGFYVLNSHKINSETLLVLFKSELMQNILKQNCSGTILTAVNKNEFLNIPIPIIRESEQEKIADLIEESFQLKRQSEQLLEIAKRSVEIAIEKDESAAMKYIDEQTATL